MSHLLRNGIKLREHRIERHGADLFSGELELGLELLELRPIDVPRGSDDSLAPALEDSDAPNTTHRAQMKSETLAEIEAKLGGEVVLYRGEIWKHGRDDMHSRRHA